MPNILLPDAHDLLARLVRWDAARPADVRRRVGSGWWPASSSDAQAVTALRRDGLVEVRAGVGFFAEQMEIRLTPAGADAAAA
jgi:hypothetical protein